MRKQIFISVLGGLFVVILISLSAGWLKNQKKDIINSIITITDKKTSSITNEIKKERCSRAELAAILFKSGIEIPTKLLISFSSADTNPETRKIFIASIIEGTIKNSNLQKSKLEKLFFDGYDSVYLSNINDENVLLAAVKPKSAKLIRMAQQSIRGLGGIQASKVGTVKVGSVSFTSLGRVEDTVGLLKNSNFTTGQIVIIGESDIKVKDNYKLPHPCGGKPTSSKRAMF